MEFKTLFPIIKKHLADGDDVPYFFRELMAMIMTVTEDEWGAGKDPSVKPSDETVHRYIKRKLPKKLSDGNCKLYGEAWNKEVSQNEDEL